MTNNKINSKGEKAMEKNEIIIPNGYEYFGGTISTGIIIESIKKDQFVWIPGGETKNDGFCEGFFVSRYEISKTDDGSYASKSGEYPIVDISYMDAMKFASTLGARIISDKQFERIIAWVLETGDKTEQQVYEDSSEFGNYKNVGPKKMTKTGYNKKWMCKNIDNLAGNLWTWTCTGNETSRILRGGSCACDGDYTPLGRKIYSYLEGSRFYIGLRVVL